MKCDELEEWYAGQFSPSARVYGASEVDAAIDELKTEHHRERHEYIEMAAQLRRKNCRMKRALWLAREWRARCEIDYWGKIYEHYKEYYNVKTDENLTEEKCERMIDNWRKVAHNCRAKAEEYK